MMQDVLANFMGPVQTEDILHSPYIYSAKIDGLSNDLGGSKCADNITQWTTPFVESFGATLIYHPASESFVDLRRARNVVSIMCGYNDFAAEGHTAAQIYADILTLVGLIKTAGATAVVDTAMDATTSGWEAVQTALNTSIRNGAAGNGYSVCDFGADAHLGCSGCASNLTYFQADGVHPTATGIMEQSTVMSPVLSVLGLR